MIQLKKTKKRFLKKVNIDIGITKDGVKTYPPHMHETWEIMTYLYGTGYLYTPGMNYPFKPGAIILVPPRTTHGSVSKSGFKNISIGGDFNKLLLYNKPILIHDDSKNTGTNLAKIIYDNRFAGSEFLHELCTSYIFFLLQSMSFKTETYAAIDKIIGEINDSAFDSAINLNEILNKSGYSEDYIRSQFKLFTGKTPTAFLTEIRINRARFLISVYGKSLSLQEIAESCGFCDYVYFSRKFKEYSGISPLGYLNRIRI